jgi:hypothetical protein
MIKLVYLPLYSPVRLVYLGIGSHSAEEKVSLAKNSILVYPSPVVRNSVQSLVTLSYSLYRLDDEFTTVSILPFSLSFSQSDYFRNGNELK